jgi:propionyl-CoA carboxylase alpha chain
MGIRTVAVYSEVDFRSAYVQAADAVCFIGAARAEESFLDKKKIVSAALTNQCDAIHPGYGFLSENAEFAQMVLDAGLAFIGPPVQAIATLGDKIASKALAMRAGVPTVPGHNEPLRDTEEDLAIAARIGFPVLLKPAAGGGGRGMRIVERKEDFLSALAACREETRKGFGDERIFAERYIVKPRHVEIQIMADRHGNVIHLGERECSIQRRYQKVIEETPSPTVDESLRAEMGAVACALAREVGYTNAGTVEFILDPEKNFYFLEMNTRLQVEHPITEQVTSLDLVELQIRAAAGEPLPLTQEEITRKGWAIEARICAEDPSRGFLPTTGMITRYALPRGKDVRVDSGIDAGSLITIYYDSLLAKVAAWGADREAARKTLVRALNGYHIEGLTTNVDFVNAVLNHPAFIAGDLSTNFIEEHFHDGESNANPPVENLHYMAMAAVLVYHTRQDLVRESLKPMSPLIGAAAERPTQHDYTVRTTDEIVFDVQLQDDGDEEQSGQQGNDPEKDAERERWPHHLTIRVDGRPYTVIAPRFEYYRRRLKLKIDGISHMFRLQYMEDHIRVCFCGTVRIYEIYSPREWRTTRHMLRGRRVVQENVLKCPMPGLVTAVWVQEGAEVRRGQELLRMESMKMESGIASPRDGQVEKILVQPGQAVETDEVLLTFHM